MSKDDITLDNFRPLLIEFLLYQSFILDLHRLFLKVSTFAKLYKLKSVIHTVLINKDPELIRQLYNLIL